MLALIRTLKLAMSWLAAQVAVSFKRLLSCSGSPLALLLPSERLRPLLLSRQQSLIEQQSDLLDLCEVGDVMGSGREDILDSRR